MHRHASTRSCWCEQHKRENGTNRNMGTSSCPSNGGTVERGQAGVEDGNKRSKQRTQRGHARLFMKTTKSKEQVTCKMKWRNSCITISRNCSACGKGGTGMTTKAGGLTLSCAPRQHVRRWSTLVATRCTRECPERRAYMRRSRNRSRQDWRRPGKPNVRARLVAKE